MKKILTIALSILAIVALSGTASAWVEPDQMPPNGNIAAPLNTGSFAQTKLGGLLIGFGNVAYGLIVKNGNSGFGLEQPTERVDVNGNIKLNGRIIGLQAPTNPNDATNKEYVDAATSQGGGGGPMYDNRIVDMTPPNAYTEICFKNGSVFYDKHDGSGTTQGGNCVPGDRGYIIEKKPRNPKEWANAAFDCLSTNMRLPEAIEFKHSCINASQLGLESLPVNWELVGTTTFVLPIGNHHYTTSSIMGGGSCNKAGPNNVGSTDNSGTGPVYYRCAR